MGLDTADDLFYLASDLHLGAQQLLGFLYCLTGNDLAYLELQLCKIIVSDLRFCLDVNDCLLRFFFLLFLWSFRCTHCLNLFHNLIDIHTRKKDLRLVGYLAAIWIQTELIHCGQLSLLCLKLR